MTAGNFVQRAVVEEFDSGIDQRVAMGCNQRMSAALSLSFILIVAIMYSVLVVGATYANGRLESAVRSRYTIQALRYVVGGSLLVTGLVAMLGHFLEWEGMPPNIFYAIAFGFIGSMILAFHPRVGKWLPEIRQSWILLAQSFRIMVEVQLFALAMTPLLPKIMTFEGRNFDILTGIGGLVLGLWVRKLEKTGDEKRARAAILTFNVVGLLLLTNVVAHGLLSAPTQMQKLMVDPPNTAIGHFPFVWLPTFLVPLAYFLHIISLRKLRLTGTRSV